MCLPGAGNYSRMREAKAGFALKVNTLYIRANPKLERFLLSIYEDLIIRIPAPVHNHTHTHTTHTQTHFPGVGSVCGGWLVDWMLFGGTTLLLTGCYVVELHCY